MEKTTLFSKSAKGLREAIGKTKILSRSQRNLLKEIDGKATFGELIGRLSRDRSENDLQQGLESLVNEGFINPVVLEVRSIPAPQGRLPPRTPKVQKVAAPSEDDSLEDLDFTAPLPVAGSQTIRKKGAEAGPRARREAEENIRHEAEENARREAEARTRAEAEEKARRQVEEQARREQEEGARQEAEERARRKAEKQARRTAEEKARQEAETRARVETEARARAEAEEKARREAEEQARREQEERVRKEAFQERARRRAEEQARRAEAEKARQDAEARAKAEAEERARREQEERARQEAEKQARRDAEEQARRAEEERERQEANARARAEAEEKARRKAEERARREVDEQARRAVEVKARQEAEERARSEQEERERKEAEERARREAEEQVRREEEEQAHREAEARAMAKAEERARKEAAEEARKAAAERVSAVPRAPVKWGRWVAIGLVLVIGGTVAAVSLMSFNDRIPAFEQAASAQLLQPVRIKALRASFLPHAEWRFEGVTIGNSGQVVASRVTVRTSLGALFDKSANALESLQVDGAVVNAEGLEWLLFGRSQSPTLQLRQLKANNVRLELPETKLPALDATLEVGADGNWRSIGIVSADQKIELNLTGGAAVRLEMKLKGAPLPFSGSPVFDALTATGRLDRRGLQLDTFNAALHGGSLSGKAHLAWGSAASIEGTATVRMIDIGKPLAGFMENGRLDGQVDFLLPIHDNGNAMAMRRFAGDFSIDKGTLSGIDFGRKMKGESGGKTQFKKLTGRVTHQDGRTQLRKLVFDLGAINATGTADINDQGDIRGQLNIVLNIGATRQRTAVVLSGPFTPPYKELKWE